MAWIQKNTPPPNRVLNFSLRNFAGGINNKSDILQENEAYRLRNMVFDEDELMVKRKGQVLHSFVDFGSPVRFIDEFAPYTDSNKLITSTNAKLYVDGVFLRNVSGAVVGTNFNGLYFFTDTDKLYVYGKFPQASTTYIKVTGTPVNSYQVFEVISPPAYTPLDSSHKQGITSYNYTNKTVHYEPCLLEQNDTSKGFNVLPQGAKYVTVYNGRLIVSGAEKDDDNVYLTEVRNPYYFPVALPMQLPPNSDKIVGLTVYDNAIVVGRGRDFYKIEGMTNNPSFGLPLFTLRRLNTHTGLASHSSMRVAHNHLFFLGSDGIAYGMSSVNQDEKVLATTVLSRQVDLLKDPFNFTKADLTGAVSFFHDNTWYISIKDKVLIYSYQHRAWSYLTELNARSFYNLNGELIWGNDANKIAKFGDTFLDFGTVPYEASWTSKMFDMNDANSFKQFREFFIVAHTYNDRASDIRLTFEVDYVDVKEEILVKNQISVFGRTKFGERFITRNINASAPFVIGRRGRGIRFTLTNGYTPTPTPVQDYSDLYSIQGIKNGMICMVTSENAYYAYKDGAWTKKETADLDQRMKIYQVNGEYEFRGKR